MKYEVRENTDNQMTADEAATLLVRLYADYFHSTGGYLDEKLENYSEAVAIAVKKLADKED